MKNILHIVVLATVLILPNNSIAAIEKAIFAGGCFWCLEPPFEKLSGVQSVVSGYTDGQKMNPTYEEVSSGNTGHIESVEVVFDNSKISYAELLKTYWINIDPTDSSGQFCDKGEQYISGVFYLTESQREAAEASLATHQNEKRFSGKKIATVIRPATVFYKAEEYHQDYYKKNPIRYKFYRFNCGRDKRLNEVWN